jgi:hypothetical protein
MAITRLGPNQDITAAKIAGTINFKNLIINGDMSLAQRGTSFSFSSSSGYTVDRFDFTQTSGATGDCTITQEQMFLVVQGFAKFCKNRLYIQQKHQLVVVIVFFNKVSKAIYNV